MPKGKHYYTVSKGISSLKDPEFQANLQDEIYNADNPIFIRVKRYDKN